MCTITKNACSKGSGIVDTFVSKSLKHSSIFWGIPRGMYAEFMIATSPIRPGGHLKLPHPWPGQTPPPAVGGGTGGCYPFDARFATRAAASRSRQLFPSNFSKCPWCISRSRSGVTTTVSPSRRAQSSTGRFEVTIVEAFS